MLLGEHINEDLILCDIHSRKKKDVIEEMIELFVKADVVKNKEDFSDAIKKREELESTGIGRGVAIPHGRSSSVRELKVAFGRSKEGINFRALDGKPVHLVFMIAAPEEAKKEYLQIVAKIARLSKSKIMREALQKKENPKDVMELIRDFDKMVIEDISVKTKDGRVLYRE